MAANLHRPRTLDDIANDLPVGRTGRGDISRWARGVSKPFGSPTKPIRPEVQFTRAQFQPVNPSQIRPITKHRVKHDAKTVCLPIPDKDTSVTKTIEKLDESITRQNQMIDLGNFFTKMYAKLGNKRCKRTVVEIG